MIFASVGSMLPFDRFVHGVDEWAAANPGTPVFAQIGNGAAVLPPRHVLGTRPADGLEVAPRAGTFVRRRRQMAGLYRAIDDLEHVEPGLPCRLAQRTGDGPRMLGVVAVVGKYTYNNN